MNMPSADSQPNPDSSQPSAESFGQDEALRQFWLERDAEENRRSTPPEGERVELQSIWVAECFPPSMIGSLMDQVRLLGWDSTDGPGMGSREDLARWIESRRSATGGAAWFPIDRVLRPDDRLRSWFSQTYVIDLPPYIDYARAGFHNPFPGMFVVVFQFVPSVQISDRIDAALRAEYSMRREPFENGVRFIGAAKVKGEAVDAIRFEVRGSCIEWVSQQFPGLFSRSADVSHATCEVLTLEEWRSGEAPLAQLDSYLWLLGLGWSDNDWQSKELPGLNLKAGVQWGDSSNHLVLAGNRAEAFGKDQSPDAEQRWAFTARLQHFEWTMVRWTLSSALRIYELRYSAVREAVGSAVAHGLDRSTAVESIATVEDSLMRLSADVVTLGPEMEDFCESRGMFHFEVRRFVRVEPLRRRRTPPSGMEPSHNLVNALGGPLRGVEGHDEVDEVIEEDPLFEQIREMMLIRTRWLRRTDSTVRELVSTLAGAANARSQERLSESNLRLQEEVRRLTRLGIVAATVLAIIQLAVALLSFLDDESGSPQAVLATSVPADDIPASSPLVATPSILP